MLRTTPQGTQHTVARFRTPPEIISDVNTFDNQSVIDNLYKSLDVFEANWSGWEFDYIINFMISYAQYNPVGGGTYLPSPESLLGKGVVSIKNDHDSYCFAYSILASIHPVGYNENANYPSIYKSCMRELNLNC